ncbi:4-hydroxythreonine-4-phosphate dehydrogenase PdxA [Immundisolibacter sp.]|uniref:4-hydroxythreonine-4-phosphate dehydrogenase PdxA n=1 Tax=Immundisolibacter sp. TaxID=1934948 RepID=UPI002B0AFF5F|nr:4-hydroxythreonine-4-phosphate dehydrogenase PdxA [Immundisolibacter sp.]MEA3220540.1 4-hydroxythreonine-4-phosphate dehydrogenase [Immundisolibacter sp.]
MIRLAITVGEPAGIGPDICLELTRTAQAADLELTFIGDAGHLLARAAALGQAVGIEPFDPHQPAAAAAPGTLRVWQVDLPRPPSPGRPDPANALALLEGLDHAVAGCLNGRFDAMVTAPLDKGVICDAGIPFSGHTEYLAARTGTAQVVMLLVAGTLRVALATTHLPLRQVPDALSVEGLAGTLRILDHDLRSRFGIARPRIAVCGLNPHAGERGHLGREEIDLIAPAIAAARARGLDLTGPLPADTLFTPARLTPFDAVLAMYHDQGLPVLKYAGFGQAVNVTLGLPIIRSSVDHGTAYDLAATGKADAGSLRAAVTLAAELVRAGR